MKARINIELTCEECNGRLNYHQESKYVRCNTLKCSHRGVLFYCPTVNLQPVVDKAAEEAEAKKAATTAKRKATMEANKAAKEAELTGGESDGDQSAEG